MLLTEDVSKTIELGPDCLAVLSALVLRGETGVGLTLVELARHANLGVAAADTALKRLLADGPVYETVTTRGIKLHLPQYKLVIPFSRKDTDATRIKLLETELQKARRRVDDKTSGITAEVDGETAALVHQIESDRGFGLSPVDALFLGMALSSYGPERIKAMYYKQRNAKDPLRAALYVLGKGAMGKGKEVKDATKVVYPELE